jgi:KUP system potassium uptake protein
MTDTDRRQRSFNEAAHKLEHDARPGFADRWGRWEVATAPAATGAAPGASASGSGGGELDDRDVVAQAGKLVLALGALGIVYGDLGTSPLYSEQVIFTQHAAVAHPTPADVYGITSLIFWALTIIVSIKYAGFLMRAHNRGDGGGMALAALIQRRRVPRAAMLVTLGIFGAGLFFGDGMITPAISVTSAVEGLQVASPGLAHLVVPISLAILALLFAVQRFGTGAVGWLFGPVILLWFVVIGGLGLREVIAHPGVVQSLSPTWAARFIVSHGSGAFLTLGGVVLAVTGAEALYADRGHFGASPIRRTWFGIVLPAVLLSYLGQSALILSDHRAVVNPFYLLVPSGLRIPMVFLATAATIIASQAAITGSFSIARQAVQLGFLPRLKIQHTSHVEGQIYVPLISWGLAAGVVALVLVFQHSSRLADIYGVAVTGTFILDTLLFLTVAHYLWRTSSWKLAVVGVVFLSVEVSFFSSNLTKVSHGAYIPLCVGLLVSLVMVTWRRGREIVTANRLAEEGPLSDFLYRLRMADPPIQRVGNVAIYLSPGKETTPLAMRADVEHHRVFHDKVVIVSIESVSVPRVDPENRFAMEILGQGLFKIFHLTVRIGYRERTNVPAALGQARKQGLLERNLDLEHASYFVSRMTITPSRSSGMARWRKRMFITMARNATSPLDHFGLPVDKTVIVSSHVAI